MSFLGNLFGKKSTPRPVPVPSAGQSFAEALNAYIAAMPRIQEAERADWQNDLASAGEYIPQLIALEQQYGPQYTQAMLDIERQLVPAYADLNRAQSGAAIDTIAQLAPRYRAALADPQTSGIQAELARQIESELMAGRGMSAEQQRQSEQAVRAAQSARGMAFGPAAAFQEAMVKGERGNQMLSQRQAAASQFLNQMAALDPARSAAGIPTQQGGMVMPQTPNGMDMSSVLPGLYKAQQDINQTNATVWNNYKQLGAMNQGKITSGLFKLGTNLALGAMTGGASAFLNPASFSV